MSITQTLTPFDSTKQPIEGTIEFRANATYAWSWLIEHTNQQIALINQINSTVSDMNSLAQIVTTKAQEVSTNTGIVNQAKTDTLAARDITLNAKSAVESMTGLGLTGLANGDILEYNSSISKFKNTNLHSKTAKTTPVDSDELMIADSATTFSLKKITWASIKTALMNIFATLASPTFTGDPKSVTPARFDNDTSIATTEFVQRALGNHSGITYAGTRTLTAADAGKLSGLSASGTIITLPLGSTVSIGSQFHFWNGTSNGTGTIQRQGTDSIYVSDSLINSISVNGGETLTLTWSGIAWYATNGSAILYRASSSFGALKTQSGYQKLPSGLIIQWGALGDASWVASTERTITLPIAFPTTGLQVISSSGNIAYAVSANARFLSASQIAVCLSSGGSQTARWLAIGY